MTRTPHALLMQRTARLPGPADATWLAKLCSVGRRFLSWLGRADLDGRTDPPALATEQATPSKAARRTVIVSGEHWSGEPFAVTRRFTWALEHELDAPRTCRHRRRKGARRWTP